MGRKTIKQKIAKMEQEIARLQKLNGAMKADYDKLEQEKQDSLDAKEFDFSDSSLYKSMDRDIFRLKEKNITLENENKRLKEKISEQIKMLEERPTKVEEHNARHAGRKPDNPEIQAKRQQFSKLLAEHKTMREIMQIMHISRSTYYNYYRHILEQNINYLDNTDN